VSQSQVAFPDLFECVVADRAETRHSGSREGTRRFFVVALTAISI